MKVDDRNNSCQKQHQRVHWLCSDFNLRLLTNELGGRLAVGQPGHRSRLRAKTFGGVMVLCSTDASAFTLSRSGIHRGWHLSSSSRERGGMAISFDRTRPLSPRKPRAGGDSAWRIPFRGDNLASPHTPVSQGCGATDGFLSTGTTRSCQTSMSKRARRSHDCWFRWRRTTRQAISSRWSRRSASSLPKLDPGDRRQLA